MSTQGYTLHKELRFEVCGFDFSVSYLYEGNFDILYVREDGYLMAGELHLKNGKWIWGDDYDYNQFINHGSEEIANAIPAYINAHPIPDINKL